MENENPISEDERRRSIDLLLQHFNTWNFDIFDLSRETNGKPLHSVASYLFRHYGFYRKFNVQPELLKNLCKQLEAGYQRYNVPFHNSTHAANVTHAMHYMISNIGYIKCLSDMEIFAAIFAAVIHDYEHQGVTNSYHVKTKSDRAILYNDKSVNENHHISAAFFLLQREDCNILSNLSRDDYFKIRGLIIDMVISTDMMHHFSMLKQIKQNLSKGIEKPKMLGLLLHGCDISDSGKEFRLLCRWVGRLYKEFFHQGDLEREQGLPISCCCDRYSENIPESQVYFIDFICEPTLSLMAQVLDNELQQISNECKEFNVAKPEDPDIKFQVRRPWVPHINENRNLWKEKTPNEPLCYLEDSVLSSSQLTT